MSDDHVFGYVLVDGNTGAMDWDGVIHDSVESAVQEASRGVYGDRLNAGDLEQRPDEGDPLDYRVMAVVERPDLDARALAALQRQWDQRQRDFFGGD